MPSPRQEALYGSTCRTRGQRQCGLRRSAGAGRGSPSSGQVVAALANGDVSLLVPQGNGLTVGSVWLRRGHSRIANRDRGREQARWTCERTCEQRGVRQHLRFRQAKYVVSRWCNPREFGGGSHAERVQAHGFDTDTRGRNGRVERGRRQPSAATASTSSSSASTSSGAVAAVATSSMGLSLGNFSSLGNGSARSDASAVLVPVQGNTYLSVPILDFGSGGDEEQGDGALRMPRLSGMYTFGDTSPLTRFVIGLDEALANIAVGMKRRRGELRPFNDLWSEDLFHHHLPVPPPITPPANEGPRANGSRPATRWRQGEHSRQRRRSRRTSASTRPDGPATRRHCDRTGQPAGRRAARATATRDSRPDVANPRFPSRRRRNVIVAPPAGLPASEADVMADASAAVAGVPDEPWVQVTGSPRLWNWLAEAARQPGVHHVPDGQALPPGAPPRRPARRLRAHVQPRAWVSGPTARRSG